ncbi:MAG: helix-hairpin-helix domain-containing protein [Oscillospiraceae bacterium]|nr:helix-hairpin-helix domain-containing protein [Oscillospiraceae bacterium]
MDKQKVFIITGFAAIAAAALICLRLRSPRTPVILTYQQTDAPRTVEHIILTDTAAEATAAPVRTTAPAAETQAATTEAKPLCRDLNAAAAEDLQRVNGIGEALAAEIIRYRDAHGGFHRRSELLEISGIGEVLAARIMEEFEIPDELPPEETPVQDDPESDAEPIEQPADDAPEEQEPAGPYDLNTVTREELLRIPDMTEELADEILALRKQIGIFRDVYELMLIDKLSGRYFEDTLRSYLYVTNAAPQENKVPPAD